MRLLGLLCVGLGVATAAPPEPIDLIPVNAELAIAVRGEKSWVRNADRLYPPETPKNKAFRPVARSVVHFFRLALVPGLKDEMDADSPMARIVLDPSLNSNLVVEGGLVQNVPVYKGADPEAVASVRKATPVGKDLGPERRKLLADADLIAFSGPAAARKALADLRDRLAAEGPLADPVRDVFAVAATARYSAIAFRFDDGGVGFRHLTIFPDDAKVAKALAALSAGERSSSLAGLPVPGEGELLLAQASAGDGKTGGSLFRGVLGSSLGKTELARRVLSAGDRPAVFGVVDVLWRKLRGQRLAVYEAKPGQVAAVAILDPVDAAGFLDEIAKLSRPGSAADPAPIAEAVRDLGDDDFDKREAASARLLLAGTPALPHLEKALQSPDAEVRRRVGDILATLREAVELKKADLLAGKQLFRAPTFALTRAAEKRGDRPVDVLRVRLDPQDAGLATAMKGLLGPDWDKVRLVAHGRHVVALFGSDAALLDRALLNLDKGDAGLAAWPMLKGFRDRTARRDGEMHVNWQRLKGFAGGRLPAGDGRQLPLASGSLRLEKDAVQVDLWLPTADFHDLLGQWFSGGR